MNEVVEKSLKEKIEESLSKLLQFKKINEDEYKKLLDHYSSRNDEENILDELLKMFTETNFIRQKLFDIENLKAYDVGNFEIADFGKGISNMETYDIDIYEVDDGEYSSRTGIVPISEINSEYDEGVSEGQTFGIQKSLGTHPGTGKFFSHFNEDSGFMTFLLVIFLAGISSGIIFMIILNFLAK